MKDSILKEYDESTELYKAFGDRIISSLKDVIDPDIVIHSLVPRVKTRESLSRKIDRKDNKYSSLGEITDISGIRIITFLDSDVVKIGNSIESYYELDLPNCSNKREKEFDRFGYRSLHYVLGFKEENLKLPGLKRFEGLKTEIQVRSILQHAWAELEHDLGYKNEIEIPKPLKRSFTRLSALLETADIEFDRLKTQIQHYASSVLNSMKDEPEIVKFDKDTLLSFINSHYVLNIVNGMFRKYGFIYDEDRSDVHIILVKLKFFVMDNVKDLQSLLEEHKTHYMDFMESLMISTTEQSPVISKFTPLLFFLHYLACSRDIEYLNEYDNFGVNKRSIFNLTDPELLYRTYEKTK